MKKKLTMLVLLVVALVGTTSAAELATKKSLTLDVAKGIAAAASAHAQENGWGVVIAILDDGGNLVYLERMDGTQIGSLDVALQKARTAVEFKRPTKSFQDSVAGGRNVLLAVDNIFPIEGGLPLVADNQVIGAIGVSGVTSEQDGEIAAAGVAYLTSLLRD